MLCNIDVIMLIYNLTEHFNKYLKTSWDLLQYHRDRPALISDDIIDDFLDNSALFKFKQKVTGQIIPFKYLSSFRRTLEMP